MARSGSVPSSRRGGAVDIERQADFEALYVRWRPAVVALCRRYVRSEGDAEAVAQEAFFRAWRSWDDYSPERPFWPWIAAIARRLCINESQSSQNERARERRVATKYLDSPVTPDEAIERWGERLIANRVFGRLSRSHQRMLVLRDVEHWSYDEIARFEGVTVESVRSMLRRARQAFRLSYERALPVLVPPFSMVRALLRRRLPDAVAGIGRWSLADTAAGMLALGLAGSAAVSPPVTGSKPVAPATYAQAAAPAPPSPNRDREPGQRRTAAPSVAATAAPAPGDERGAEPLEAKPAEVATDEIEHFTVSPSYAEDHTVFAAGRRTATETPPCYADPTSRCSTLYRSSDGGRTWTKLAARNRTPGQVLLPPAYPRDRRIFSAGLDLQVSEDDGETFTTLLPIAQRSATVVPSPAAGLRILLGASPYELYGGLGLEYRDGGSIGPLGLSMPAGATAFTFALPAGGSPDGTMYVGGTQLGFVVTDSSIYECRRATCGLLANLGINAGAPTIVPPRAEGKPLFAVFPLHVYRVRPDGTSKRLDIPVGFTRGVVHTTNGELMVAGFGLDGGRLLLSGDDGDTWRDLTDEFAHAAPSAMALLPDGRIVVGLAGSRGIVCSDDDGTTWRRRCG
ncbi:MAG: sigma-70 family RNA polymerase sigma factor [Actinomycetota bacterium]|nr:sigma-70 family RNA polymerase sigma factor [Actinomycetota bacterium]